MEIKTVGLNFNVIGEVAKRLSLPEKGVAAVVNLLEEGATVPFISRYRKEATGGLDEVEVRNIETTLKTVKDLFARKEYVYKAIEEAGFLTSQIEEQLNGASTINDVEDIYAPYKPKKRTRATMAREKGLEPLAKIIMAGKTDSPDFSAKRFVGEKGVASEEEAIAGAKDIIAEWASESIRLRNITRNHYRRNSSVTTSIPKGKETELKESPYSDYAQFNILVRRIASHQFLALKRAEREGFLKVKFKDSENAGDLVDMLCGAFVPRYASDACAEVIEDAVEDAASRLLRPSIENEISSSLKEEADKVAINIFAGNLRQLLLAPPLKGKRVLAIDPGYRTGCKVVALDSQGNLLDDSVIYPVPPKNDFEGAKSLLEKLIKKYSLEVISLGNGTASRETEKFLKDYQIMSPEKIYVVSENGASVYSASEIARKEFPDKDVTVRGAVSIGRRLIDPLAELVKIDPKSIGVGQYQHDVDQTGLKDALDYTVMSCVNSVGVDVNTASEKLLSYISGIGPSLASNIVNYRTENGDFPSRESLKMVPRLGAKAFEQSAGFLRVPGGVNPLDNTGIHPENYDLVKKWLKKEKIEIREIIGKKDKINELLPKNIIEATGCSIELAQEILNELSKPGRDPRLEDENEAFVPGISDFNELREGMQLPGIINNITAFGAFVNLGIKENGLLHISRISSRRINSVDEVLRLGQRVEVKVIGLERDRKRISLELVK